jgi:hypothetical protein
VNLPSIFSTIISLQLMNVNALGMDRTKGPPYPFDRRTRRRHPSTPKKNSVQEQCLFGILLRGAI